MMLEKLGSAPSSLSMPAEHRTLLEQRLRDALGADERRPDFGDQVPGILPIVPEFGTKPLPPSNEAIIEVMVKRWWQTEFMQAMLLGDPDEKLGMKPEPYAD